jgi:hypothetical protein
MNLHSRKTRLPIAALGVTALCTTGLGVLATSAQAATLGLLPSDTSASIIATDRHNVTTTAATLKAAETAYALKLSGVTGAALKLSVTGTAGGVIEVNDQATNGAVTDLDSDWTSPASVGGAAATVDSAAAATDIYYIGSQTPGAYTLQFFEDINGSGSYEAGLDNGAAAVTLNVKDIGEVGSTTGGTTADDLSYSVAATSPIDQGEKSTAKVTLTGLSTSDARGNVATKTYGVLGNELTDVLTTTFSGIAGLNTAPTALAFNGTTYNTTSGAATASGNTGLITAAIGTLSRTAPIVVADNSVAFVDYTNTDTANVDYPATNGAATVRAGTSAVTYTVLATKTGHTDPAPNATVFFRVVAGSGLTASDLSTSAGTPDSDGDVIVKTGTDGIAKLTVTSAKTANSNAYTVAARSNGASAGTITSTYATAVTSAVRSGGNVAAKVGTSAQLTGTVLDQFGQPFYPGPGVTATLNYTDVGAGGLTPVSGGNYAINTDGTFSATLSELPSNTTVSTDTYRWTVQGVQSDSGTRNINWVASITPGTVTVADITIAGGGGATVLPFVSPATTVDLATSGTFAGDAEVLRGVVRDDSAGASTLPSAAVTYTGSDGVWFYDATNKLVKTLTARTNSSGQLSYDESTNGVRVLFTKTGPATVTIKAGAATGTAAVTVEPSTDAYQAIAQDATGEPGSTITLLGKVLDAFGNPATNRQVTLTLNTVSAGTLTGTDGDADPGFQVTTDSQGVWSTPFTSTSNQNGEATLTVTLRDAGNSTDLTTNPTVNAAYAAAGQVITHGEYQDTATITVDEAKLTISTTGALLGGGKAMISGTAPAGRSIKVFIKPAGATGYTLGTTVVADSEGDWGVGATLKKSTSFYAESGALISPVVSTTVFSYQTVKAKALGKGKVRFTILGVPNVKGTATVWYGSKKLGSKATNSAGDVTFDVQSSKGRKSFKVYFSAPGTSMKGTVLTGTVK